MITQFDKRLEKVEEEFSKMGEVPAGYRGPFITWEPLTDDHDPLGDVKQRLMEQFNTIEGATFNYLVAERNPPFRKGGQGGLDENRSIRINPPKSPFTQRGTLKEISGFSFRHYLEWEGGNELCDVPREMDGVQGTP